MSRQEQPKNTLFERANKLLIDTREFIRTHNRILPEDKEMALKAIETLLKNEQGKEDLNRIIKITEIESVANRGDGLHNLEPLTLFAIKLLEPVSRQIYLSTGIKGTYEKHGDEQSAERTLKDFARELGDFLEEKVKNNS